MGNDERRIVMYVDGSAATKRKHERDGKTLPIGWGVVALHDDAHHEIIKGEFPGKGFDGRQFEFYAFIEAVQYAVSQGFRPNQISIHTDEPQLYWAGFLLHPENYVASETVTAFHDRLKCVCEPFGPQAYENVLACLKYGIVSRVTGSEFSLYHKRAHYLANAGRHASAVLNGEEPKPFLAYDEWLATVVFTFYMSPETAIVHGILGPFQPEKSTGNGVVWEYHLPFTRAVE